MAKIRSFRGVFVKRVTINGTTVKIASAYHLRRVRIVPRKTNLQRRKVIVPLMVQLFQAVLHTAVKQKRISGAN